MRPEATSDAKPRGMSIWVYAVGPVALVMLLIMRHFGLVADIPLWAYASAILGSAVINKQTAKVSKAMPIIGFGRKIIGNTSLATVGNPGE